MHGELLTKCPTCVSELEKAKAMVSVLRDGYNSICDDLHRGEHIDMDWVKGAIEDAAHSHMAKVYRKKIKQLEKALEEK